MKHTWFTIPSPHDSDHAEDGFSLLELVVAVSIMLILGTTGFVSYQSYTENARKASADSSANEVLTAVLAADDSPGQEATDALEQYNGTSNDMTANVQVASDQELVISTTDRDGKQGFARISGDYRHIPTTEYSAPGISYAWTGTPHRSASIKLMDGEEVSRNLIQSPRVNGGHWETRLATPEWGGWQNGHGAKLTALTEPLNGSWGSYRAGIRTFIEHGLKANTDYTVSFDAQRVTPGDTVRVILYRDNDTPVAWKSVTMQQGITERHVIHLQSETDWNAVYIDFMHNDDMEPGSIVGYVDRVMVEEGITDGEYFDGDSR